MAVRGRDIIMVASQQIGERVLERAPEGARCAVKAMLCAARDYPGRPMRMCSFGTEGIEWAAMGVHRGGAANPGVPFWEGPGEKA